MDGRRKKPAIKTEMVILTPIITIPLKITLRAKPAFKTLTVSLNLSIIIRKGGYG